MTKKYQITAEIKKGWQEWGSVKLITTSKMTESDLMKIYGVIKVGFMKAKVDVQIREFLCERI